MFSKIQNPETGKWVNVRGAVGKRILQNYMQFGGSAAFAALRAPPPQKAPKCPKRKRRRPTAPAPAALRPSLKEMMDQHEQRLDDAEAAGYHDGRMFPLTAKQLGNHNERMFDDLTRARNMGTLCAWKDARARLAASGLPSMEALVDADAKAAAAFGEEMCFGSL